ncbi:coiled-coil and C2 domain-containing protein 1-like [Ixodes scapularis]|uniref:coiled-coil and C2 domain-containing protein 1-like n=1 Tax=Ixodes scapularis TaxID=6945 RepID=UPI001C38F434|nr:coiled-coil and C2 domain-containing protein 1-like [Ixodes scapularis]
MAKRAGGAKARSGAGKNSLAQLGLFDIPDLDNMEGDDDSGGDGDDEDLEAELSALLSGKSQAKPKKPAPKPAMDLGSIQMMAAAIMKDDTGTDEEDDANLSDDPDLVAELQDLAPQQEDRAPPRPAPRPTPGAVPVLPPRPVTQPAPAPKPSGELSQVEMLQERLQNYLAAEAAAKSAGDTSKVRRFGRAIKTLESLVKKARAGGAISEEDIPPPVAIPKAASASAPPSAPSQEPLPSVPIPSAAPPPDPPRIAPSAPDAAPVAPPRPQHRPAPPAPPRSGSLSGEPTAAAAPAPGSTEHTLTTRRDQYKHAALSAKKRGDQQTAIKYIRTAKQFDTVLAAIAQGQPVDLTKMPPPPPEFAVTASTAGPPSVPIAVAVPVAGADEPSFPAYLDENVQDDDPSLFNAPPPPTSVLEALQQRLEKYQSTITEAKGKGDDRKVRRLGRIVKQYEDAIKLHKAGKPVDFEELPAPPGFGPIPVPQEAAAPAPKPEPPKPAPKPASRPAPARPAQAAASPATKPGPSAPQKKPLRRGLSTTIDKQMEFLLERQKLFREAALEAKRRGDREQAKEYLRMMKGLDPMIQATEAGLPINATSIPIPPQLQEDFVVVEASECEGKEQEGTDDEAYRTLERELVDQHQMCVQNKDHFFKLGDVSSGTKFEKLAQEAHRDLLVVRNLWQRNDPMPRFHYETRVFTIVRCNHDLTDNELEVSVVRAINLPGRSFGTNGSIACSCRCGRKPDELDSYVRVEFPFPNDAPQSVRTRTVKDTINPEFQETFKFEINRKSRSFARITKRHPIKLEVWAKRGFLRSDAILGTVAVKFEDLETKCDLHDSYDVFDSKRPSGGKLEVKVRVREPFVSKQVEEIKQRWLIIGS